MKIILTLSLILISFFSFGQSKNSQIFNKEDLKVYLKTDINYSSSTSDTRRESQSATGTLGMKFENGYLYGSSVFTVHSQNTQISTSDSSEMKLFGTNLLLPQNSTSNISNFELQLGTKSFFVFDSTTSHWKKWFHPLGCQMTFRVNNTTWQKSTEILPITIASFSLDATYRVLDVQMAESEERIKLILGFGYTNRRLGGDYGLDKNSGLRQDFLGTDKLGFNGVKFTTRLEVSKFYGQIDLTSFSKKNNIAGFSGDQAIISIGIRADLPLPTKIK